MVSLRINVLLLAIHCDCQSRSWLHCAVSPVVIAKTRYRFLLWFVSDDSEHIILSVKQRSETSRAFLGWSILVEDTNKFYQELCIMNVCQVHGVIFWRDCKILEMNCCYKSATKLAKHIQLSKTSVQMFESNFWLVTWWDSWCYNLSKKRREADVGERQGSSASFN